MMIQAIEAGMTRKTRLKRGTKIIARPSAEVSLAALPSEWDMGATGPANRDGLVIEERPTIDPETGKKSNPNGVRGVRRETWVSRYLLAGKLTIRQANAARSLYDAAHGGLRADPLAALRIDQSDRSDPQAAAFDRRRDFHRMWNWLPDYAKPVVERVVLRNSPIWHGNMTMRDRHFDRLRRGLDAMSDHMDRMKTH